MITAVLNLNTQDIIKSAMSIISAVQNADMNLRQRKFMFLVIGAVNQSTKNDQMLQGINIIFVMKAAIWILSTLRKQVQRIRLLLGN